MATIDGAIRIPLSELRAYRDAERLHAISDPRSLAQKRAVLEALVNEYLYVDDAYRARVPASAGFSRQMEATRTMILTDCMAARAAGDSVPAPAPAGQGGDAAVAMAERLFEAASITVSNEAYSLVKRAAQAIDAVSTEAVAHGVAENGGSLTSTQQRHAIIDATPAAVLVRYENKSISVQQILVIYAGLPASRRPRVATEHGLIEMIKPLILPELMAIEATKRGIAAEPAFERKLIQNRNALLRFHVHGMIESRANDALRAPDLETRLESWYRGRAAFYATTAGDGKNAPPFAEVRDRVLGDFSVDLRDTLLAEKARELRNLRSVVIHEDVLDSL